MFLTCKGLILTIIKK